MLSSPSGMTLSYDVENRMTYANTTSSAMKYAYDGQNKRMFSCPYNSSQGVCAPTQTFYFYGPNGKLLATFNPQYTAVYYCSNQICQPTLTIAQLSVSQYFGSRLLGNEDRLGSRGRYYPYGEDRGTNPGDGSVTFATYTRDSSTGLNYADQRYYATGWGRFVSPDRYRAMAASLNNPGIPQSWNRYAYVTGDPANYLDPTGKLICGPNGCGPTIGCDELEDPEDCDPFPDPPPPQTAPPPLKCDYSGAFQYPAFWGFQNANGPNGTQIPVYGYWQQISISFIATGGDGPYTWSDVQTYAMTYGVAFSDGEPPDTYSGAGTESLRWQPTNDNGSRVTLTDSPGIGFTTRNNNAGIAAFFSVGNFTLQVSVTDADGTTAQCATVWWQAVTLVQTINGSKSAFSSRKVVQVGFP